MRPGSIRLAVHRVAGRERAGTAEDLWQDADPAGREVTDNEDGGGQRRRQIGDEPGQGFDAAGRRSDRDDAP